MPALVVYVTVYVPALVILAVLSVFHYVPGNVSLPGFTLHSYVELVTTSYYLRLFADTLELSLAASVLAVALSYPLAYSVVRSPLLRKIILPVVTISFFVSAILVLYGWIGILGRYGVLNSVLLSLHLTSTRLDWLFTNRAVLIGLTDSVIPFAVLILAASLSTVDRSLELAAQNLGATRWQTFLRITLPLTRTGVLTALALSFAQSVSAFVIPLLLGGGRVPMLATQVYDSMIVSLNYPFASATVMLILAVILVTSYGTAWIAKRSTSAER